jgi:hypothetical protein
MTVLTQRVAWSKPKTRRRAAELTEDEQAHVRKALAFLRERFGSWEALANAMGVEEHRIWYARSEQRTVTAAIAIRSARAARVPLEDILGGAWPKPGTCPHCGRG